jgi:hypothetical protein
MTAQGNVLHISQKCLTHGVGYIRPGILDFRRLALVSDIEGVMAARRSAEVSGGAVGVKELEHPQRSAVFERITLSVQQDFPLEAIALLDSLLWDRLSNRLQRITKSGALRRKLTLGQICHVLVGAKGLGGLEKERQFLAVEVKLLDWVKNRNRNIYSSAHVFRDDTTPADVHQILELHRQIARDGIELLREFEYFEAEESRQ